MNSQLETILARLKNANNTFMVNDMSVKNMNGTCPHLLGIQFIQTLIKPINLQKF